MILFKLVIINNWYSCFVFLGEIQLKTTHYSHCSQRLRANCHYVPSLSYVHRLLQLSFHHCGFYSYFSHFPYDSSPLFWTLLAFNNFQPASSKERDLCRPITCTDTQLSWFLKDRLFQLRRFHSMKLRRKRFSFKHGWQDHCETKATQKYSWEKVK